jgi:hypothetical protein
MSRIAYALGAVLSAGWIACGVGSASGSVPTWALVWVHVDARISDSTGIHILESRSSPRPVARGGRGYFQPSWSPDGTEVAFTRRSGVYVVARDGSRLRRVASGSWEAVVWSPGGRLLALANSRGVSVVPVDGNTPRRVLSSTGVVSWSSDDRLVCQCGTRIVAVDVDGTDFIVLATTRRDGVLGAASSSSDGALVAFGRRCWRTPIAGQDLYCALAVERADGSGVRTLIPYRRGDEAGPLGDTRPLWIPGTHRLLVLEWNKRGFVDVDADTGARRVVRAGTGWGVVVLGDGTFAYLDTVRETERMMLLVVDRSGRVLVRRPVPPSFFEDAAIYLG